MGSRLADQKALLTRQTERKFDAQTARWEAARIESVRDLAALVEVGDSIIDCSSGGELVGLSEERADSDNLGLP